MNSTEIHHRIDNRSSNYKWVTESGKVVNKTTHYFQKFEKYCYIQCGILKITEPLESPSSKQYNNIKLKDITLYFCPHGPNP